MDRSIDRSASIIVARTGRWSDVGRWCYLQLAPCGGEMTDRRRPSDFR